ncbi:hypothetical protein [Paraburkholderia sp. HP33-1]|uniref:hypothetical protein n=1 Tax=Paraburkholderia sp. HP33-1 TaxID=2883243 RepID=UPI001F2F34D1|nr:hypothetical protein [Paraburkholderia sp. HP33-1]
MRFSRNFMDIKEAWGFRIASWWRGVGGQLSREEHDELQEALQAARDDFLRWARPESWTSDAVEMDNLRRLLGRTNDAGRPPIYRMNNLQVARAICREIERGSLIFVPSRKDVERYIEEERKRRRYTARANDSPRPDTLASAVTSPQSASSVPASPATPLNNAQPFNYQPDMPDGDAEELAASTNKENYAARMLGYDRKTFGDMIHAMKYFYRLRGDDNVIWHDGGDVEFNGEIIDNMHNWAP